MRIVALLCSALAVVIAAAPARATDPPSGAVVLERAAGLAPAERGALRARTGVVAAGHVAGIPRVDVVAPADGDRRRALSELRADPAVLWAEPVLQRRAAADALMPRLWGLANTGQAVWSITGAADADIDAPEAWALTRGSGVTVAVVDGGVASAHTDLAPQLTGNPGERGSAREHNGRDDDGNGLVDDWRGWDYVDGDNVPEDLDGHGSHVAGTAVGAAGGGDVVGVAPAARLLALRALDADGIGFSTDVAAALAYAGDLGVPVVNASLTAESASLVERAAIHAHPGTLYVVAAGNRARDAGNTYPCAYDEPNLICVGASDQRDRPASFSNFSPTTVDLFAPGVNVVSSYPLTLTSRWRTALGGPPGYEIMDGTSMASPHAAGAAALVAALHPGWPAAQLGRALVATADPRPPLAGKAVSGGRLNAAAAVAWTPTDVGTTGAPPAAPVPAPSPAPVPRIDVRGESTPVISRLRLRGRPHVCQGRCRQGTVTLSFVASKRGKVRLLAERRVHRRYRSAGRTTLAVTAGRQRVRLGARVAGARLRRGKWRLTLAAARISFTVR